MKASTSLFRILIIFFTGLIFISFRQGQIQKISAHLRIRTLAGGKFTTVESDLYYKSSGELIAHFLPPLEYVVMTNRKGNSRIYNVAEKTTGTEDDAMMGSSTSYFNCFLNRKMADMGLRDLEFQMSGSRYENPYSISVWIPAGITQKSVSKIELAHLNGMIAYAGYFDPKGKLFKKVFYSKGKTVQGVWLPENITAITYVSAKDSIVEKSEYSDFRVNEQASSPWFDFQIPADAKPMGNGK